MCVEGNSVNHNRSRGGGVSGSGKRKRKGSIATSNIESPPGPPLKYLDSRRSAYANDTSFKDTVADASE